MYLCVDSLVSKVELVTSDPNTPDVAPTTQAAETTTVQRPTTAPTQTSPTTTATPITTPQATTTARSVPATPSIIDRMPCPEIPDVANGAISYSRYGPAENVYRAEYTCNEGYQMNGPAAVLCVEASNGEGMWATSEATTCDGNAVISFPYFCTHPSYF